MTLTLRTIRSTRLTQLIAPLYLEKISPDGVRSLLQVALLFLNADNQDVKDFGYRLLLKCCILSDNYVPLYDIAAQLGYIPIMSLLKARELLPERNTFLQLLMDAYQENFRVNNTYQTERQNELFDDFSKSTRETVAVIAPTSYGKSELIEQTIKENPSAKIAIIVPSKALISQTRRRVVESIPGSQKRRVIVHHDTVFEIDTPLIAVMTQERLLRLYQKSPTLHFDILFIDEAHNLLSADKRSRLLASAIIISQARNRSCAVKYLTPFLISSDSLQIVTNQHKIKQIKVYEKLKSEEYYFCDTKGEGQILIYDQFFNKFFTTSNEIYKDELSLLRAKGKNKNVVYLNKPKSIEQFAHRISRNQTQIATTDLERICSEIADYVHPQYKILNYLRRGVGYHHGSVPDIVRSYIETSFRTTSSIKWIITNSTLLEGVNIPAETIFILDPSKGKGNLSAPQFRNLVGRVNRFSEIFHHDRGSPKLLLPPVYLINCGFSRANANFEKYLTSVARVDKDLQDTIENPLLVGTSESKQKINEREDDFRFIENIEPAVQLRDEPELAATQIGKLCYAHNVYEINIKKHEIQLQRNVDFIASDEKITDALQLMNVFAKIFIFAIEDSEKYTNLARLDNLAARSFYAMFFDWRMNQVNYGRMISSFVKYWHKILDNEPNTIVFVGRWGNISQQGSFSENYIDLKGLSEFDLINLAVVRIKEEQDFIDNNLIKFVEILNDLNLVELDLYNKIKYGTTDSQQIALVRSGLTHIAATVLATKYRKFYDISSKGDVKISSKIRDAFDQLKERDLIKYEIESSGLISQS